MGAEVMAESSTEAWLWMKSCASSDARMSTLMVAPFCWKSAFIMRSNLVVSIFLATSRRVSPSTGEFQASFAFYTPRVFKATGSTKMYYRDSVTDPQMQQSTISFRHRFICLPKKEDAGVVIASGYKAV